MTRAELLSRMSSAEFTAWAEYFRVDPWGEERADMRAALICKVLADINRGKRRPFELRDFMLDFGGESKRREQSWQDQLKHIRDIQSKFDTDATIDSIRKGSTNG